MRIVLLFLSVLIFSQTQVFADEAKVLKQLQVDETTKDLKKTFKEYPDVRANLENAAVRYLAIKSGYEDADKKGYNAYPNGEDDKYKVIKQANFNYYYTKCKMGDSDYCKNLEQVKKIYGGTFDFNKLQTIEIPKVDGKKGTFTTLNGDSYNVGTEGISQISKSRKISNTNTLDTELKCEWADVFPRKILHGPGCKAGGSKICTGYVSCSLGERKINRLATCSERYCTDSTATECANQPGYGSKSAEGVKDQYQSDSRSTESSKVKSNQ